MKRPVSKREARAGKPAAIAAHDRRCARLADAGVPSCRGRFFRTLSPVLLCALLAGCAMMNAEECQRADWHALGVKDGAEGRPAVYLQQRVDACTEASVAADTRRYAQGRDEGLQHYCRLENAFPTGASGGTYAGVCPPTVDAEFRRRFSAGRAVHDAGKEVKRIQDRIESRERDMRNSHKEEERRLRDQDRDEDRRRIRREFDQRRDRLRAEIGDLDRDLRRARDRLYDAERAGLYQR